MTKKEEEIGAALLARVSQVVNQHQPPVVLAGLRCEVFADADGNVWARDPDTQELVGRVRLLVLPCPT